MTDPIDKRLIGEHGERLNQLYQQLQRIENNLEDHLHWAKPAAILHMVVGLTALAALIVSAVALARLENLPV